MFLSSTGFWKCSAKYNDRKIFWSAAVHNTSLTTDGDRNSKESIKQIHRYICHRNQPKLIYLKRQFGKSAIKTKQKIDPVLSPEVLIQFPIPFLTVTCFCWYQHLLLSSGVRLLPMDHCYPCLTLLTHSVSFWTKFKFLAWHLAQTQGLEIHTHVYTLEIYTYTDKHSGNTHTRAHACACLPTLFYFLLSFSVIFQCISTKLSCL